MNSSPASSQARQLARNKGLAWVTAITLGAGAASALGAGVIAVSMQSPSVATTASSATTATTASASTASAATRPVSTTTNNEEDDVVFSQQAAPIKAAPVKAAPLKAAPAPATSTSPPVATTAAS